VLPLLWGTHDIFHASLLLPYQETAAHGPNFTRPPPDLIEDEEEYEVEAIVNHRCHGYRCQLQYLIKWKGYPSSNNTWEAVKDIHTEDLVKGYHWCHPLEPLQDKAGQGTKKLAHVLYSLTVAPSPTQRVASWLLHSSTPLTRHSSKSPLTLKLSRDRQSTSISHLQPASIAPNANMPSNILVSATTCTASTTPPPELWLT